MSDIYYNGALIVEVTGEYFYMTLPQVEDMLFDQEIAELLNMSYDLYISLLKKYRAFQRSVDDEYMFDNTQDVKDFIDDEIISSYLSMYKIGGK